MKGKGKSKGGIRIKIELEDSSSLTVSGNPSTSTREPSKFPTVLQKRNLNVNDLREVQFELESQLIIASKRKRQLENKIFSLETLHSKKDKRSRSDSTEKRGSDERPPKKARESSSKASSQHKSKFIPPALPDPHQETPKPPKNDAPSRFWSFIEPYCADITQDIIRTIEDWINPQESDEKFYKIPELGKHFSEKWVLDDLTEEIIEGSKSVENHKGLFNGSAQDLAEIERIKKLGEDECSLRLGNATILDRLVHSLVEENLMTELDDTMNDACDDDIIQKSKPSTVQTPSSPSNENLEKRLHAKFIESGLLEPEEEETEVCDDEVSQELKKLQGALIPVHEYNIIQKKKLLALAKAEMAKQEIKKKLQELDAKVMETYRTVANAKRTKTMNKKLEDQIKRILRERRKLIERLSNMK
ncbi:transcriptional adapter 3-like [Argiope bruennichi]|uniref:Transcriptional adapter 3 like protein n=1 Tax=Argiope bruennichi TaxID=94029 RepID=A0A8T0FU18_ARGBR|nr:transcriptional adapter 3-like [Argiope bruennichi]KAF8792233.1 Transcriptional adapter 3 like protein [Argiope bruennichi]